DAVGPLGVLLDVTVELHVPPPDLRAQLGRRGIVRVMDPQIRVYPLVDVHSVVDESLGLCPAPGLARTQVEPEACVLPARDEPVLSRAVAFPVELAARIDEPLGPEVRAVKQVSNE